LLVSGTFVNSSQNASNHNLIKMEKILFKFVHDFTNDKSNKTNNLFMKPIFDIFPYNSNYCNKCSCSITTRLIDIHLIDYYFAIENNKQIGSKIELFLETCSNINLNFFYLVNKLAYPTSTVFVECKIGKIKININDKNLNQSINFNDFNNFDYKLNLTIKTARRANDNTPRIDPLLLYNSYNFILEDIILFNGVSNLNEIDSELEFNLTFKHKYSNIIYTIIDNYLRLSKTKIITITHGNDRKHFDIPAIFLEYFLYSKYHIKNIYFCVNPFIRIKHINTFKINFV